MEPYLGTKQLKQALEIQVLKASQNSLEGKLKASENEALNLELKVWDMKEEADGTARGIVKGEVVEDDPENHMASIESEGKAMKRRADDMETIGKRRRFA